MTIRRPIQRRWNEFKSGRHMSGVKRRKKFLSCPPLFWLYKYNQLFWLALPCGQYSLINFLFFVLTVGAPCPVICKSGGTFPHALDGVSVTFVLQFHTKKHYKTAIQSECMVSRGLFSQFLRSKLRTEVILLTRFCKLLTRVATLSGRGGARASSASMARRLCVLCDLGQKRDLTRSMTVYSATGLKTKIKRGAMTAGRYYV